MLFNFRTYSESEDCDGDIHHGQDIADVLGRIDRCHAREKQYLQICLKNQSYPVEYVIDFAAYSTQLCDKNTTVTYGVILTCTAALSQEVERLPQPAAVA